MRFWTMVIYWILDYRQIIGCKNLAIKEIIFAINKFWWKNILVAEITAVKKPLKNKTGITAGITALNITFK